MMTEPLVSICIPTYNGEQFLEDCLLSISNQLFRNFEVVVSDNLSTDNTLKIIEDWKPNQNFSIQVISNPEIGIGNNWNNCIRHAKGKYVKFLFQDDVLLPNCLIELVRIIELDQEYKMASCQRQLIDEKGTEVTDENLFIYKHKILQNQFEFQDGFIEFDKDYFKFSGLMDSPMNKIGEPTAYLFEKDIVNEIGYYRTDLNQLLDLEFCYRILKKYKIVITDQELVQFRVHSNQATSVNKGRGLNEINQMNSMLLTQYFPLLSNRLRIKLVKDKLSYYKRKLIK